MKIKEKCIDSDITGNPPYMQKDIKTKHSIKKKRSICLDFETSFKCWLKRIWHFCFRFCLSDSLDFVLLIFILAF